MAKLDKDKMGLVAEMLQENLEDEAEAVKEYQKTLNRLTELCASDYLFQTWNQEKQVYEPTPTAEADKKFIKLCITKIKEYIAEEIKHQKGLQTLYEYATGIKEDKEHK